MVAHLLGGLVCVEQGGAPGRAKNVGLLLEGEDGYHGSGGCGVMVDPGAVKGALGGDGEVGEALPLVGGGVAGRRQRALASGKPYVLFLQLYKLNISLLLLSLWKLLTLLKAYLFRMA